jgi:hypothetical protein
LIEARLGRRAVRALLAGILAGGLLACSGGEPASTGRLPDDFPARFPIPDGAEVVSTGDVVRLRIETGAEETANYYERALPASGWQVIDRWSGTDPHGQPTFGMVIEQAEASGALSFTPVEDDEAVIVHINLRQPTVTGVGS